MADKSKIGYGGDLVKYLLSNGVGEETREPSWLDEHIDDYDGRFIVEMIPFHVAAAFFGVSVDEMSDHIVFEYCDRGHYASDDYGFWENI